MAKGVGHNYYGEPAWPNDILYVFPIVILGTVSISVGLSYYQPYGKGEPADPFSTPQEILPEWYFFPVFNLLRLLPSKLIGVFTMASVPLILTVVPFIENISVYQNPFRRPISSSLFLISVSVAVWSAFLGRFFQALSFCLLFSRLSLNTKLRANLIYLLR